MDHCASYEFGELWNSDALNSVCVNNKQAWFCTCLYKLVHSSFGTSEAPAYPFGAKTVSFMFWLSFWWQFCKSNIFCVFSSFPLSSLPPYNNSNILLSSVIQKLVEKIYCDYPMMRNNTKLLDGVTRDNKAMLLMEGCCDKLMVFRGLRICLCMCMCAYD